MKFKRSSGVLLHPTSFPGANGIGELGAEAYRFIDFLDRSNQQYWQVMPLGPTSFGDSPYQCFSAFAGNPLLVSLDRLRQDGLLSDEDLAHGAPFPPHYVDYGRVIEFKAPLLQRAFANWREKASGDEREQFAQFREENISWLDDYALFMALKESNGGAAWIHWPKELANRKGKAVAKAKKDLADVIERQEFYQFLFMKHWSDLRHYANERGIRVVGDLPIFVAFDSADVWANPELFYLDKHGNPTVVAGVPPDYFSETGQRWGNPLYRWDVMAEDGYRWWVERFRQMLRLFDVIRIDHFRGFEAYWEVPAEEETAMNGQWVDGPKMKLFKAVKKELGDLPIIAEDLGVITEGVEKLLEETGFPGMKVIQFAFDGDPDNIYLPHNYTRNDAVYSGTHDNDTCEGWYRTLPEKDKKCYLRYTGYSNSSVHWMMMRMALASVANIAIMPLQDILGLGSEARMNTPGQASGNWSWRYNEARLDDGLTKALGDLTATYGREPIARKKARKAALKQA